QSAYIELSGIIDGDSQAAGGGVWRRFEFISDGLQSSVDSVQLRLTSDAIDYYGVEDGCLFSMSHGAVWAYGGDFDNAQHQPMFIDEDQMELICDAPKLLSAAATAPDAVTLTFSRPIDESSLDANSFEFTPSLDVLDIELSANLKTVT